MSSSASGRTDGSRISAAGTGRALLMLGVLITAASFLALLLILGLYFAGAEPHPVLYFTSLWGFPVGFTLMVIHVLYAMSRRRRRRAAIG